MSDDNRTLIADELEKTKKLLDATARMHVVGHKLTKFAQDVSIILSFLSVECSEFSVISPVFEIVVRFLRNKLQDRLDRQLGGISDDIKNLESRTYWVEIERLYYNVVGRITKGMEYRKYATEARTAGDMRAHIYPGWTN